EGWEAFIRSAEEIGFDVEPLPNVLFVGVVFVGHVAGKATEGHFADRIDDAVLRGLLGIETAARVFEVVGKYAEIVATSEREIAKESDELARLIRRYGRTYKEIYKKVYDEIYFAWMEKADNNGNWSPIKRNYGEAHEYQKHVDDAHREAKEKASARAREIHDRITLGERRINTWEMAGADAKRHAKRDILTVIMERRTLTSNLQGAEERAARWEYVKGFLAEWRDDFVEVFIAFAPLPTKVLTVTGAIIKRLTPAPVRKAIAGGFNFFKNAAGKGKDATFAGAKKLKDKVLRRTARSAPRPFRELIRDAIDNPSSWRVVRTERVPSTNLRNRGGTSQQELLRNVETGEEITRHTLFRPDGTIFELPHFRPFWR
ncbi:MAG: hypothetical protein IH991_04615, partial [Planctomycetes bacterium]|nr:hypothetical protein [Planctomycetota bacterium]